MAIIDATTCTSSLHGTAEPFGNLLTEFPSRQMAISNPSNAP
jgi:hypothetical protein